MPSNDVPLLAPKVVSNDGVALEASPLALGAVLLSRPRILFLMPLAFLLVAAAFTLGKPRLYVAESVFRPQSDDVRPSNRIAGIAAQFGVDVAPANGAESLEFYAELLDSRELLKEVALTPFAAEKTGNGQPERRTLVELLDAKGETAEERTTETVGLLRDRVSSGLDLRAGVITLQTAMPTRALAVDVNNRLLELLNQFNLEKRQSQARAERQFIESRLSDARSQLQREEARLAAWLNNNKRFEQSATLRAEEASLQRQVELRQQVFTTLANAYEEARVDEVRNTPVITLIDRPDGFTRVQGRGLIRNSAVAMVIGAVVAACLIFLLEYMRRQRVERPQEFAEFDYLRRTALRRLAPIWVKR